MVKNHIKGFCSLYIPKICKTVCNSLNGRVSFWINVKKVKSDQKSTEFYIV